MADIIGRRLGNYRLVRHLGHGGFAEVYLGEHLYLKSEAALKVLLTSPKGEDIEQFLQEAQTLVGLRHPNIVRVLEFGVEGDIPFLVMDYAPGGTTRHRFPTGTRLPLTTAVAYIKQVAGALQYAHNRGIIHRDVKPENILLDFDQHILLSDFGLALFAPSPELLSTQKGAGTALYMPPEQLQGKPTFASDQYALAVVTYEWLCGKHLFEGDVWALFHQHMYVAPPPLRQSCPDLPAAVDEVILRALAKDPQQRFTSIQAFTIALERVSQVNAAAPGDASQITAPLQNLSPSAEVTPTAIKHSRYGSPAQRRVFLTAAPADEAFAARLQADLHARGILISHDHPSDISSADQQGMLRQDIRDAHIALVVVSPQTRSSRTVKEQVRIISMYQRHLVFVWAAGNEIAGALPEAWGRTAMIDLVDAREARYKVALDEILAFLEAETSTGTPEEPTLPTPPGEPRNPYKGLRAFTGEDAADFFGRDMLIEELAETIEGFLTAEKHNVPASRLLTVIGPSGSGKSSVVMAGLLPGLQRGALPGSEAWVYLDPIVPGKRPLESLTLAFAPHLPERSLRAIRHDLEDDSTRGLQLLATQLVKRRGSLSSGQGSRVVLMIDQFEELFTQTLSERERQRFIDLLVAAVTEPVGPLIVLLTLRADFYDRPMHYPQLSQLIEAQHKSVLPMNLRDLRAVIEQPAALPDVQLLFEGDLVGDLLFEAQGQAGALPLLEFTLDQLFRQRDGHWLTREAYQQIGGVKGALAKHAESTYAALPSGEHRRLARALFLRLIDPGVTEQDTTRRRAPLAELSLPNPEQTKIMREVADTFVGARLLMTNEIARTTTIEVSHEALIREWTHLAEWLREAREDITLQQAISTHAAEWVRRGRPIDRLYRGTQLTEAQVWAERNVPNADEVDFLHTSVVEREYLEDVALNQKARELYLQRRVVSRQRLLIGALSIFSVVVILLASLAEFNFLNAQALQRQAELQAQIDASRAFAALANNALLKNEIDKALLLGVKANLTRNTFDARDSLLNALEYSPRLLTILQAQAAVNQVAFRPGGQTLVSFGSGGEVTFWNMKTRQGHTIHLDFRGDINTIPNWTLSPGGQTVAGASDRGLWLWDATTGAKIAQLEPANQASDSSLPDITPIAFSPGGNLLASSRCAQYDAASHCTQGRILLWHLTSQPPVSQLLFSGPSLVTHLAFSPDGKTLLSSSQALPAGSGHGSLQLWDVASGKVLTPAFADFTGVIATFVLSQDGKTLAASDGNNSIFLWDLASQKALVRPLSAKNVQSLAFSPDGNTLASGSIDNAIQLWDVTSGLPADAPLKGHSQGVTSLAFSPDGKTLTSSDSSGAILLWKMTTGRSFGQQFSYTNRVFSAIFSPDGKLVAAGNDQGKIILQDAATGNPLAILDATAGPIIQENNPNADNPLTIESLAFSPDKRLLAAGRFDGTIFLWNAVTKQPITHFRDEKHLKNIVFNTDSRTLAASYDTGAILLLNTVTHHALHRLTHPSVNSDAVSTVAFSPGGQMLASGNNDVVTFWNVATGRPTGQRLTGHQAIIKSVVFSPDGHTLASIDENSNIMLWDVGTMKPRLSKPLVNVDPVTSTGIEFQTGLAFSPDGTLLAAGGDQSASIWDVAGRERITNALHIPVNDPLNPYAYVREVAFSPDGQHLLIISDTYSANYSLTMWNINRASWQAAACSIANRNFTLDEWQQFAGNQPYQKVCSNFPVDRTVIYDEMKQAHADVLAGNPQGAQALYGQAAREAAQLADDDVLNGNVCWYASTDQFAQLVLSACDRAVSLNRYNGEYFDNRGVARALTGNRQGAIADFSSFVQWATNEYVNAPGTDANTQARFKQRIAERNAWIQKLEAGQNPFSSQTLQALRVESGIDQ